ncbi:MAG: hypothetical protein GXO82_05110 [Chlorobi bacterium]|nr:hypothetical protein [Chlorobiota bacterium]
MKTSTAIFLLLVPLHVFSQSFTADQYKEDYLEACALIASKYVYFERKCDLTRTEFLRQKHGYADSITWDTETFVKELRKLRGAFPDGHFFWSVPRELSPVDDYYTLGFVATFTSDSALIVRKVYPYYAPALMVDDTIIEVNGVRSVEFIKEFGKREPQSTLHATYEVAARNLSFIKPYSPPVDKLEEMRFTVRRKGARMTVTSKYRKCTPTTDVRKSRTDSAAILVQRNGYLSLEEIPDTSLSSHPSLLLYELKTKKGTFCVLHPRDFFDWDAADIDTVMGIVNAIQPEALVIDLKDCSGGAFNEMLYLSHAVNVTREFRFFYDIIDKKGRRVSGVSDFHFITERISLRNTWKGKLLVRSNEICGSACDFFVRWMRINNRADIVGTPPAGRGGGTDDFILKNTKASINFPLRERIPLHYTSTIEGETVEMDYSSERNLYELLDEVIR